MCHGGIYSVPALSSCSVPLYSFFPRHASAFALSGIKFTDFSFVFPFPAPPKSFFLPFSSDFVPFSAQTNGIFRLPVPFRLFCANCTVLSSVYLFLPLLFPSVPLHSLPGKIFRSSLPCPDLLRSFLYLPPPSRNLFYSSSPGICSVPQMNQKINPRKDSLPRFRSLLPLHGERLSFNETVRRPQRRRTVAP